MSETQSAAVPAPRKRGGVLKLMVVALAVLVMGAGGAWWLLGRGAAAAHEVPLSERGLVSFEPFLVNLADSGGNRFLKATVQLVMATPEEAAHMQETPVVLMHARSAILELLTQQSAPVLVTQEGKDALKAAIKARVTERLGTREQVVDVLFSEFVVQF